VSRMVVAGFLGSVGLRKDFWYWWPSDHVAESGWKTVFWVAGSESGAENLIKRSRFERRLVNVNARRTDFRNRKQCSLINIPVKIVLYELRPEISRRENRRRRRLATVNH
jgi:hypothetical protein